MNNFVRHTPIPKSETPYNWTTDFNVKEYPQRIAFLLTFKMDDGEEETFVSVRKGIGTVDCYFKRVRKTYKRIIEKGECQMGYDDRLALFLIAHRGHIKDCTFMVLQDDISDKDKSIHHSFINRYNPTINKMPKSSFGVEYKPIGSVPPSKRPRKKKGVAPKPTITEIQGLALGPDPALSKKIEPAPKLSPTELLEIIQGLSDLEKMIPYKIILEPK